MLLKQKASFVAKMSDVVSACAVFHQVILKEAKQSAPFTKVLR